MWQHLTTLNWAYTDDYSQLVTFAAGKQALWLGHLQAIACKWLQQGEGRGGKDEVQGMHSMFAWVQQCSWLVSGLAG